jgi:hypothetical protein
MVERIVVTGSRDAQLTLVVIYNVPQMISSVIMRLAHAHRVVREVDIAVIAFVGCSIR